MYHVLRNSRIRLFPRKSIHIFNMAAFNISQNKTVLRQSYRMFIEQLIEAHYPRLILGLSRIPHLTTLQKFIGRINYSLLDKDNFIFHCDQRHQAKSLWLQIRLDLRLSCFTVYIGRTELKIKFAKLSIAAETYYNKSYVQMTRWAPTRHDNIDYKPIIISTPKYPSTVRRYSC